MCETLFAVVVTYAITNIIMGGLKLQDRKMKDNA